MRIRDIMSSPAITVTPDVSVQQVASTMRQHSISGVPVVDAAGALVGLITELDMIRRNAPLREPTYFSFLSAVIPLRPDEYRHYKEQLLQALATNAEELMGSDDLDAVTVTPEMDIEEALERMSNPLHVLLPVVEGGRVIGVVTRTDIVRTIEQLELELIQRESQSS